MSLGEVIPESPAPTIEGLAAMWKEGWEMPRLSRWGLVSHHCTHAWQSFRCFPVTTVVTLMTVTLSLLLFGGFLLVRENVERVLSAAQAEVHMSVFFRDGVSPHEVENVTNMLQGSKFVASVAYLDKSQALSRFRAELGEHAIIAEGLDAQNPLPASLEVTFKEEEHLLEEVRSLANKLGKMEQVEYVNFGEGIIGKLGSILGTFRVIGIAAVVSMMVITAFIIASTIRLAIHAQREEIAVMRLVGATEWFMRAPFAIEGILEGLLGAAFSLGLLYLVWYMCQQLAIAENLMFDFLPEFHFLSISGMASVLLVGTVVSLIGVILAVGKGAGE